MRVRVALEADVAVVTNAANVSPQWVVALPPSEIDPSTDEMRVVVGGVLISRAYDPLTLPVTGAPIAVLTEAGDTLVTEDIDRLIWEQG